MEPTLDSSVPIYAGDTFTRTYTFTTDGDPTDLSAWTFTADWRPSRKSTTEIPLTVDATQKATGIITVSATATDTRAMAKNGVYDLQGVQGATVRTFIQAETVYTEDVTRP